MADNTPAPNPAATPANASSTEPTEDELDAADTEAASKEAAAPKKETKAEASRKKKFALKIDGRDEDVEFDPDNEEEVKKHLQFSRVAQKRMQSEAEYRKNIASFFDALKNDPVRVLSDPSIGIDLRKMAEAVINNEVEELKKSPEQREKEKLQRELESIKKQSENEKKQRDESDFKRLQEQSAIQLDTDITTALENSGLPKSPYTVKKMAEFMMIALQNNIDLGAKEIIPLMKKQMTEEIREMFSSSPEEMIEEFLGKENISRLRKKTLQRLKAQKSTPSGAEGIKSTGAKEAAGKEEPAKEKIPMKKFLDSLGRW